jgi:hypothetical protein
MLRHLVDSDRFSVLLAKKLGDFPVIDVQDPCGKGRLRIPELFLGGDVPGCGKGDPERDPEENGDCKRRNQKYLKRGTFSGTKTH